MSENDIEEVFLASEEEGKRPVKKGNDGPVLMSEDHRPQKIKTPYVYLVILILAIIFVFVQKAMIDEDAVKEKRAQQIESVEKLKAERDRALGR